MAPEETWTAGIVGLLVDRLLFFEDFGSCYGAVSLLSMPRLSSGRKEKRLSVSGWRHLLVRLC